VEARQRQIKDWLSVIRRRQILLPRFQRFEAWGSNTITSFLTSVVRDLPVGSALVLGVGDKMPFVSRPLPTAPESGEKVTELLLDGQQRLTALWRALHGNYEDKSYFVRCDSGEPEEVEAVTRWERNGKTYPMWADEAEECWRRGLVPFCLLDPDDETRYQEWADVAGRGDDALARKIERTISRLRSTVSSYNLPFLYLETGTPPDVAIEVFIKLNTTVVPLTAFDIVVAQTEAATGEPLHDMVDSLKASAPGVDRYGDPEDLVLSVAALLQDKTPSQRGYLSLDMDRFVEDWPRIVEGANKLVEFLEQERVLDRDRLPTESVLPPLAALWAEAPILPDDLGNLRVLLRKYMWSSFFSERYDRAVSTGVQQDYRALRQVIQGAADESKVPCLDREQYPLPTEEVLVRARWPRYKDRLARAILALSLRCGAEDLAEGVSATPANIGQREYHHVFPVAYMAELGSDEEAVQRALNCILITWKLNRKIGAKEPLQYLVERADASSLGEAEIRRRLKSHLVEYDWLAAGDYEA